VRQQLDSFDSFLRSGLTDCMQDSGAITYTTEANYGPGSSPDEARRRYTISFDQVSGTER
jgi:hypothetical protein